MASSQDTEQLVSAAQARSATAQLLSLDAAALLLRVGFGLTLALVHGLKKLEDPDKFLSNVAKSFPAPGLLGWGAILSELAGGILLALGLFTRSAGTFIAGTLFVAAFKVHAADPFTKKELAFAYALVGLAFAIGGPGRYALDTLIARRRS